MSLCPGVLRGWAGALALAVCGMAPAYGQAPGEADDVIPATQADIARASAGALFKAAAQYCTREVPSLANDFERASDAVADRFKQALQAEMAALPALAKPATESDRQRYQRSVERASTRAEEVGHRNEARKPVYCQEVLARMGEVTVDQLRLMLIAVYPKTLQDQR